MTRTEYFATYGPLMSELCQGTGLFASVMAAQGCIETATKQRDGSFQPGTSKLFFAHNHFGIKAQKGDGWEGATIQVTTWEVVGGRRVVIKAAFRMYASDEEGFADRIRFLRENPRYTRAGVFRAATPEAQAVCLKLAGYATDPNYPALIRGIILQYGLSKFDKHTQVV